MVARWILAACCAAAAFGAEPAHQAFPYPYQQEDLPNGLRLITVPTDYPNLAAVYIVVRTGSRNEVEPGHTGFAHLFEHLMFKGTEKYPAAQYTAALQQMGAASNAYTTDDYTCYHTTFSKEDLRAVLAMEADRFQNLKYTEPEFKTEALAVLGEYNKNSSNPSGRLGEVVADTAFDIHTYKHTTMGFLKDIQDMPNQYAYSLQFFDRYYRPEYTTIVVVGDVKPKAVRTAVDKLWGDWKRGSFHTEIPQEPPQQAPRTGHVAWPSDTLPLLRISFKVPAYTDSAKNTAALDAIAFLAFSPSSDLYQKLVIRERKADQLFARNPQSLDPFLFSITARVKQPEDMDYVRGQILDTIRQFRDRPVEAARLNAVRDHLRYSFALAMNSSDAIAAILAPYVALRRTPETINKFFEELAALTPDDVRQAASRYLTDNGSTIVTLTGPRAEAGGSR